MRRRTRQILTVLSMLGLVAVLWLWLRSYQVTDSITRIPEEAHITRLVSMGFLSSQGQLAVNVAYCGHDNVPADYPLNKDGLLRALHLYHHCSDAPPEGLWDDFLQDLSQGFKFRHTDSLTTESPYNGYHGKNAGIWFKHEFCVAFPH